MHLRLSCYICVLTGLAGCATTGPSLTKDELAETQYALTLQARRLRNEHRLRLSEVGQRLLAAVPELNSEGRYPYIGWIIDYPTIPVPSADSLGHGPQPASEQTATPIEVTGVVPDGPADRAGLQAGDRLLEVDGTPITSADIVARGFTPGREAILRVERQGQSFELILPTGVQSLPVRFGTLGRGSVGLRTTPKAILMTNGLLRMAQSDDELAVLLGHALGHLAQDSELAQEGEAVLGTVPGGPAPFGTSHEVEWKADEVGLQYARAAGYNVARGVEIWKRLVTELDAQKAEEFLKSHPISPGRLRYLEALVGQTASVREDTTPTTESHEAEETSQTTSE